MCALFNDGLYHIHIHLGAQLLEAELHASSQHLVFDLVAGQVMSPNVILLETWRKLARPITFCNGMSANSTFPLVETAR